VLASSPHLASGDLAAFHAQARSVLPFQQATTFVLADPDGQLKVNTLVDYGKPLPRHANAPLQRAVLESGRAAVSDLFTATVAGRPLVAVEVPVIVQGRIVYTLGMGFTPERISSALAPQRPEPDWVIAVFDRSGTIVARTHQAQRFVGLKAAPAVIAAAGRAERGVVETDALDGVPVIAAFARSPLSGWTVVVGVPRQILLARVQRWIALLVGATAVLLGAALAVAFVIGRRIAASMQSLIEPARALERGEPVRVAHLPLREADTVGSALTQASALLQSRTRALGEAARAAFHDALTGLPNRAHFLDLLAERLQRCGREGGSCFVFFVDLDDFKPVNDAHGHQVGDRLLCSVAARLRAGVRGDDVVARLGGDEFTVLLEDLSPQKAYEIAAALAERLSRPYVIDQLALRVTACIGVACYPGDGRTPASLLEAADAAMYRAKKSGKGRFEISGHAGL
jgi:diguanylate cyclase (GGDEF)-like protein